MELVTLGPQNVHQDGCNMLLLGGQLKHLIGQISQGLHRLCVGLDAL